MSVLCPRSKHLSDHCGALKATPSSASMLFHLLTLYLATHVVAAPTPAENGAVADPALAPRRFCEIGLYLPGGSRPLPVCADDHVLVNGRCVPLHPPHGPLPPPPTHTPPPPPHNPSIKPF